MRRLKMAVYLRWSTISTAPLQIRGSSFSPCPYCAFVPVSSSSPTSTLFSSSCSPCMSCHTYLYLHLSSLLLSFPAFLFSPVSLAPLLLLISSTFSLVDSPRISFHHRQNLFLLEMPLIFFLRTKNSFRNLLYEVYIHSMMRSAPSILYLVLRA